MTFLSGDPELQWHVDTTATLLKDVVYEGSTGSFTVPAGYRTDGATTPRCTSWIYAKFGAYLPAAIVHDWLITDLLPTGEITSNEVDKTFRDAMKSVGVPAVRRWIMWSGVRLGAIINPRRRAGSLKTFPGVLLVMLLASPVLLIPSLIVQIHLWLLAFVSIFLPKAQKVDAQTQ